MTDDADVAVEALTEAADRIKQDALDSLGSRTRKSAFNLLETGDLPRSVPAYLAHAGLIAQGTFIWLLGAGYVELTEKAEADEAERAKLAELRESRHKKARNPTPDFVSGTYL